MCTCDTPGKPREYDVVYCVYCAVDSRTDSEKESAAKGSKRRGYPAKRMYAPR